MVGGEVIEVLKLADRIWVNCREEVRYKGVVREKTDCAIYVELNETSLKIEPGDNLWWQGNTAMWTPQASRVFCYETHHPTKLGACWKYHKCGVDYDIQIPKIGYSGVTNPAKSLIDKAYDETSVLEGD